MSNAVICIAGMHRSGTSMIARVLNQCGLSLGPADKLLPANENNQDGYWEHRDFFRLNKAILRAFHGGWDFPPTLPAGWENDYRLTAIEHDARQLLGDFSGERLWGWKDPRNSLTLPFWKRLVPDLKVVVSVRNPLDVAASLKRRGSSSEAFAYNLWLRYDEAIAASIPGTDHIYTNYDSFFADPQTEIIRLARWCGLEPSAEVTALAAASVRRDLKHHAHSAHERARSHAPRGVMNTYATRQAQARGETLVREPDPFPTGQPALASDPSDIASSNALLQRRVEDLSLQLDMALSSASLLSEQVKAMLQSRSWRVTKPLRGLTNAVHAFAISGRSRR